MFYFFSADIINYTTALYAISFIYDLFLMLMFSMFLKIVYNFDGRYVRDQHVLRSRWSSCAATHYSSKVSLQWQSEWIDRFDASSLWCVCFIALMRVCSFCPSVKSLYRVLFSGLIINKNNCYKIPLHLSFYLFILSFTRELPELYNLHSIKIIHKIWSPRALDRN